MINRRPNRERKDSPPLLLILICTAALGMLPFSAAAQDWRLSAGYTTERFGLNMSPNSEYLGDIGFTQKGLLEAELERYLLYRLYLSISGDMIVHNQESIFLGGPINFNRFNTSINGGIQWDKLGFYAGLFGGSTYNLTFKGYPDNDQQSGYVQIEPMQTGAMWQGGYRVGAKYYLMRYLRIHAEARNTWYSRDRFTPDPNAAATPQLREVSFQPVTFSVGISISFPWNSRQRIERLNDPGRYPSLMSVRGVNFASPVADHSNVTSPFGSRWGRMHEGVDLDANRGDRVVAAASGVVTETSTTRSYGNKVVIRHGSEYTTIYAHLNRIRVREGDRVRRGEVIGTAGDSGSATGVHLHFEIRRNGEPVDPQRYIRF
jgi:murein DD-endopeptidase MepM/ murein hydrolase activator NlpD